LHAPARALNRGQPKPGGKVATAPERLGRWGQSCKSRGRHSPDPRDGRQPTRDHILLGMPGDLPIEPGDALVQRSELLDQHSQKGRAAWGRSEAGSSMAATSLETWTGPLAAITPNSARWPRSALL